MALSVTEVRAAARVHTKTMFKVLHGVATNKEAPHASRVAAANSILDRAWGKPDQAVTLEAGQSLLDVLTELEARREQRLQDNSGDSMRVIEASDVHVEHGPDTDIE